MIDFPNNPTDGQAHTEADVTWVYRSPPGAWQISNAGGALVEIIEGDPAAGWQVQGDMLVQWGQATPAATQHVITYPQPFAGNPSVTASGVINTTIVNPAIVNPTSVTLNVYDSAGQSTASSVFWIAIGEAPDALKKPKSLIGGGGAGDARVALLDSGMIYDAQDRETTSITGYSNTFGIDIPVISPGSGEFIKGTCSMDISVINQTNEGGGGPFNTSLGMQAQSRYWDGTQYVENNSIAPYSRYILTAQLNTTTVTNLHRVELNFNYDETKVRPDGTPRWSLNTGFRSIYTPGRVKMLYIQYDWRHYRRL